MKPAFALLLTAAPALAVNDVKIGDHPTSRLTAYPSVLSLHAHGGRLYMGYGTREDFHPAIVIASYDPALHKFRLEHSAATDELTTFRTIGDTLYAAHNDPSHYEDFRDYSYRGPDGIWRDAAPAGCLHVYDVASAGGSVFFCGSKSAVEGAGGGGILMGSADGGASWQVARTGGTPYTWCYGLGSRLYFQNGVLENGSLVSSGGTFGSVKTRTITFEGQPLALHLGTSTFVNSLSVFDGTSTSTLHPGSVLYAWDEGTLYSMHHDNLTGKQRIFRTVWLSPTGAVWEATPVELSNSPITSLAVLGGRAYFGVTDGSLRAANLDGTPLTLPATTVQNDLPDSFGRGLAATGNWLACGAPDTFSTQAAAGSVEIWQDHAVPKGWTQVKSFAPPVPRLSNWFGKDVAMNDDVLAVVEAGYDLSGRDRGKDSRVHLYQRDGGLWPSRAVISVPFAHHAALLPDFLAVATANASGSQAAGHPGVTPYRIVRAANDTISLTAQTQLKPVQNGWGYKPSCRIVMQGDLLMGGFAGDPSRSGGQGMVSIWRRAAGATSFSAAPEQEIADPGPNLFGFALALDGHWLAVGAPRNDTAAPQAGAVLLYKRASLTAPFALAQSIVPPAVHDEAAFGSALALRGATLLIGAPGVTVDGIKHRGAVYVFRRGTDDIWSMSGEMPRPSASLAEFGVEVAMTETRLVAASRLSGNTAPAIERLSFLPHPESVSLYDTWRAQQNLTGTDSDADGVHDLMEYAVDLQPRTSDASAADHSPPEPMHGAPQFTATGAPPQIRVTWLQRTDDPRLTTRLEYSSDLQTWTVVPSTLSVAGFTGSRFTLRSTTLPVSATGRQYVRQSVSYDNAP